jgi:hypothetical protein
MSITAAIVVILVGIAIAAFLSGLLGTIVAAIGVVGLVVALWSSMRARA